MHYALIRFKGDRRKSAEWLCISEKTVRNRILKMKELKRFKNIFEVDKPQLLLSEEQQFVYGGRLEELKCRQAWILGNDKMKAILNSRLVFAVLNEG